MSRNPNSAFVSRLAAVALLASSCALAGCGRKGGLDLPPSAAAQETPAAQSNPDSQYSAVGAATAKGNVFDATPRGDSLTVAPRGPNKRIILDPLLD